MTALFHHAPATPAATICGSDAMFMVRSGAEDTDVCAAHLQPLLTELWDRVDERPVHFEVEPGRKCFYRKGVAL